MSKVRAPRTGLHDKEPLYVAVPFGKYLLQRKLAEGGMAEIFLAQQPGAGGFQRRIVVKRLLPERSLESEFVRMFLNEARLAARLNHPNIVQIYELEQAEGSYYLAMEYIHGEDLRALAQQADAAGKRPGLGLVVRIIADVLAGLHYAHIQKGTDGLPLGLVHRDISPQNILVTYDGGVKIIDFGIAKATQKQQSDQTQAGLLKGKYAYMSPEQTRGDRLDARSDVFSAGILLWEMITWRRLFKRATDLATLVAVSEEPAPRPSQYNPAIPEELDGIVLRALAVEPEQRFASAQDFQAALEECLANQGWEGDGRALKHYMREIFRDKLAREEAEEAASMEAIPVPVAPRPTMPLQAFDAASLEVLRPPGARVSLPLPVLSPVAPPAPVAAPAPPMVAPAPLLPPPPPSAVTPARPPPPAEAWPRRRIAVSVVAGLVFGFLVVALLQILGR